MTAPDPDDSSGPDSAPAPPRSFENYKLLCSCGRGAFGEVFMAEDLVGRLVALKILPNSPAGERELDGLRHYRRIAEEHPNLVRIFHIGSTGREFYYTMELADNLETASGRYRAATLEEAIRRNGPLDTADVLRIGHAVLRGLACLERNGLIHRDIKPSNIIFVDGVPKLSDVGLITDITRSVSVAGTFGFLPPETLEGTASGGRSGDLYSLGKVLYCALTGLPPQKYPWIPREIPLAVCRQFRPVLNKACSREPEKRFQCTLEFQRELPRKLRASSGPERYIDSFRHWCRVHDDFLRRFRRTAATVLVALLFAAIGGAWLFWLGYKEQRQFRRQAESMYRQLDGRAEMYDRYFRLHAPEELPAFEREREKLARACRTGNYRAAGRAADLLGRQLDHLAEQEYRKLPDRNSGTPDETPVPELLKIMARLDLLREFPFYDRLARKRKQEIDARLKSIGQAARSIHRWPGPLCGRPWNLFETPDMTFQYVAPGGFRFGPRREFTRIDAPFWIASAEVTNQTFRTYYGFLPSLNREPDAPVEQLGVNDMLAFCRAMTLHAAGRGLLPEGYILRLPSEIEWEYALAGAWRGAPELAPESAERELHAWLGANSGGVSHPIRQKAPNRLGLFDMIGNVTEVTTPSLPTRQNAFVERGGSFKNNEWIAPGWRCDILFEATQFNWCGFRMVLAPGDMSYFDRMWQEGEPQHAENAGVHYELFGLNAGQYRARDAALLAELLGGRLAQVDSDTVRKLRGRIPHLGHYPTLLGGRMAEDGVWRWTGAPEYDGDGDCLWKDGEPIPFEVEGVSARRHLYLEHEHYRGVGCDIRFPLFLCEWSADEFARRDRFARSDAPSPLKLKQFRVGNSEFLLVRAAQLWCMNKRFAELLGGRLAVLDTPEKLEAAVTALADFRDLRIALGGYYKYDRWFWIDGSAGPEEPRRLPDTNPPSRNNNFLTLFEGELADSTYTAAFLCEWPDAPPVKSTAAR